MIKRILGLFIPASVVGAGVAASGYAYKLGFIPQGVWFYLWPSLIAVLFLAMGLTCLFMGMKRWLWPLGTGFLVQTIGIILMWAGDLDGPWDVLQITVVAVVAMLMLMLIVWMIVTLRARWLEKKMLEGIGGEAGMDQQELHKIRNGMQEALALLKRAGRGRNAIYELPWFLVIGRTKGGKTFAIKNSGLSLPVRKDWVKGVGGTHTVDWFFTNELIFLDTPGEWVSKVIDDQGRRYWTELLKLLRRYRGRRPLDGLAVVVPADDLLSKTDEELQDQASNIREVIDLLHGELKFRFPVYVLVSKCDLVDGFVDFFKGLPAQRRHEILGWSHDDPNSGDPVRLIPKGFKHVLRRLEAYRLEMLGRVPKRTQARRLFFFTENFRRLERPLSVFTDILFLEDPANEPPVFRGFYLTSATQGEGTPMGEALSSLARTLGVRVSQTQETEEEPKRSYFLLELFRTLMVGDEGLVSRTAMHWWRRRRDTLFVAFLPAGLAVAWLLMSLLSYTLNAGVYSDIKSETPRIVEKLRAYQEDSSIMNLNAALDLTEQLRREHKALDGFTLFRRFGMRRPGTLRSDTFEIFREQFTRSILDSTLRRAEEFTLDPDQNCADRMDVFYSVIWLRQGHRGEMSDDLRGLERIWEMSTAQTQEARVKLLSQFWYLKENSSENQSFLTSISLAKMANSIKSECGGGGSLSALDQYMKFQQSCVDPPSNCDIVECREKLDRVLEFEEKSFGKLVAHMEDLKTDLRDLIPSEPGADDALEAFRDIGGKESKAGVCQQRFEENILPALKNYAAQQDLIDACNSEWDGGGKKTREAFRIVRAQKKGQEDTEKSLRLAMKDFSKDCFGKVPGFTQLDSDLLFRLTLGYRLVACTEQDDECDKRDDGLALARRPASGGAAPARVTPAPVEPRESEARPAARARSSGLQWFDAIRSPGYTSESWNRRKSEWAEEQAIAQEEMSGAQKTAELERVRSEVEGYARQYVSVWEDYLNALELKVNRGSVPLWLEGLSATPEFRALLLPAAQALQVGDRESEPPFDAMRTGTASLGALTSFVEGGLRQYQAMLGKVASDLKRCESDHGFWAEYRSQVGNEGGSNSLVQAAQWLDMNAGAGLAQGRLRKLLEKPLSDARDYIRSSGDLTGAQWKGLTGLWADMSGKFPFAGDPKAPMVEEKDLRALLGAKSGFARVFYDASQSVSLTSEARNWVDQAGQLSRIFFVEGQDELQPLHLRLEIGEATFEPADYVKTYRVDEVLVYLGGGLDFNWKAGQPKTSKIDVPLFGKEASEESMVKATLSEKKGVMGRALSKENWTVVPPKELAPSKGAWAPIKLIAAGLPPGSELPDADKLTLTYTVEVPYKKNNPGKIKIPITVEGKGLARLIALMKEGLPAPPATSAGNQ